jgi:glycosyltransferase involved in cell wall biosynthesis
LSIDILMATFNGEKYLRNQLLSLQQQTFSDWVLWVRDDGSTDGTLQIIDEFTQLDSRVRKVDEGSGQHFGAGRNFLELVKYATLDYVIFCDQDDIWFEKKLEMLIGFAAEKFDKSLPCLVYCDAYGYSDSEGIIIIESISQLHAKKLEEFLFFNAGYQGCSILFNRELANVVKNYRAKYYYLHDDVVSLVAHVFGKVYFLPKCLMLYRQHAFNVTGNISSSFFDKLRRIVSVKTYVLSKRHYDEKRAFFEAYFEELDDRTKRLFIAYLDYPKKGVIGRIWLVLRHGFSIGGHRLPLIIKTLLRRPIE